MVASLNGVIFEQIYGDNSGGAEFDTDGDGTATQEDEFVSFLNPTGASIDLSGWQVWSDSTGTGAPDSVQDGLYHTFAPGTSLEPGKSIFVINQITGTPDYYAVEASAGGVESGAGGLNTNFLSEGSGNTSDPESIALVNPATGEFLVFNMAPSASSFSEFDGGGTSSNTALAGFPGTTMVAEIDGSSVQADQNAGSSYQYDSGTDSYVYGAVYLPCFVVGTLIETPTGPKRVETLKNGDLVLTKDRGPLPVMFVVRRCLWLGSRPAKGKRPIVFSKDSLGKGIPNRTLALSPQHRVLIAAPSGQEMLSPAKAFIKMPGVREDQRVRRIGYVNILLETHEVILAHGTCLESMYLGEFGITQMPPMLRNNLRRMGLLDAPMKPARPFMRAGELRRVVNTSPWPEAVSMY